MLRRIAAVIFHAPLGTSEGERLVEAARWAASLGLARRLRDAGVSELYVVTSDEARCPRPSGLIEWLPTPGAEPFHFGHALQELIAQLELDGVLYFGSGSGGLLAVNELARLAEFARQPSPRAVFNNFHSCDFFALADARRVLDIELPAIDNPLGHTLADAGFPCLALPRNAATQFDIDTPTELALLARSAHGNEALRAHCARLEIGHPTLDRALEILTDRTALTLLVGRLSPVTWSQFETEVACRTGALSEGRGLRAHATRYVPWLRQTIAQDGPDILFERLKEACDAAWIDSRPLLAEAGKMPPAGDRFASDLFRPDEIGDPTWRAFTQAARDAGIPIVLGGHSLVSGDLYLAADACWKGRNLARRLHPEPFV